MGFEELVELMVGCVCKRQCGDGSGRNEVRACSWRSEL